jgi:hypothetical protein
VTSALKEENAKLVEDLAEGKVRYFEYTVSDAIEIRCLRHLIEDALN